MATEQVPTAPLLTDHGQCLCGGRYEERFVEIQMRVGDETLVLPEVPQLACLRCNSRVYRARLVAELEVLMRGRSPTLYAR